MKLPSFAVIGLATGLLGAVAHAETVLFLMSGPVDYGRAGPQSYVVAVSDPSQIQQARDYLRRGGGPPYLVPKVAFAAGADGVNLNYSDPAHPAWPWHVTQLVSWTVFDPAQPRAAVYISNVDGFPSIVPDLLAGKYTPSSTGDNPPLTWMQLVHFPLTMELTAGGTSKVINVSTRGWVAAGERSLIAGFVVDGNAPRNVAIRGLGPSLAKFGVAETLADPKIFVYHGTTLVSSNDNWRDGSMAPPDVTLPETPVPFYYPNDPNEAGLLLTLPPGAYTVVLVPSPSGGAATGVGLIEVYDVDAHPVP